MTHFRSLLVLAVSGLTPAFAVAEGGHEFGVAANADARSGIEVSAVSGVPVSKNNADEFGLPVGWGHYADIGFGATVGYSHFIDSAFTLVGRAGFLVHGSGYESVSDLGPTRLRQVPVTVGLRYFPAKRFYLFGNAGINIVHFEEQSFAGPQSETKIDLTAGAGMAVRLDYVDIFGGVNAGGILGFGSQMHGEGLEDTMQVVFGLTFPLVAL